jgi:fatty-acyl-CoA synthase
METISEILCARATDQAPGLVYGDSSWTWAEAVSCSRARAALATGLISDGPPHICVLLDNVPEFSFWLGATALSGHVLVGGNPNHRGDELSRDISHTECQLLVTDIAHLPLVDGLGLGPAIGVAAQENPRILLIDSARYQEQIAAQAGSTLPGSTLSASTKSAITSSTLGYLIFTSGTSGAPKAVRCSQGRMAFIGSVISQMFSLGAQDVCYVAMPMFHSNALMAGWAPALASGATIVLPSKGRFSASGFLPDVRRHGVTYFNYVGKPLSYILATPERPDDADTSLRQVFGNEGASADVARFAERFGCPVVDGYGSTEGGANVSRTPDAPSGSLGLGVNVIVVDPETGTERARARFDENGRLVNSEEAIGEMVSTTGAAGFEGYWRNEDAESQRIRNGWYWTGDLGYCDEAGYLYFAGRTDDWLRVDGENFAAAPVTRILERHPDVVLAAVYAVPDPVTGDQVMAALQLKDGSSFDPEDFAAFLQGQRDLGTKWVPGYLRICGELPTTATAKILTRSLRKDGLECDDPVWRRAGSTALAYELP